MALPQGGPKFHWPPVEAEPAYMRYSEHSAWYDGSPLALAAFYGGYGGSQLGGQSLGFFNQNLTYPEPTNQAAPLWRKFLFWAKQPQTPVTRLRLHVPLAADIATTSTDLLFSEEPTFYIPEAKVKNADSEAIASQKRLAALVEEGSINTQLLEAGEVSAALGGVYLKTGWDQSIGKFPLLTAVHADAGVPEFLWGRLTAVTFWKIVQQDEEEVWRHLERHEPGAILHGLYRGDRRNLGTPIPLTESPYTADLANQVTEGDRIETQLADRLTAVYIPNMRPNRADRGSSLGRSDYAGLESVMDALDETYTSWMRDIRLGRARIIARRDFFRSEGKGKGADFDSDREVWESVDLPPDADISKQIMANQFEIRYEAHQATALELVHRIVAGAGYSGSTFGLQGEGTIKTATEIAAREQRSLVTRGKKAQYWGPQLRNILETMLMLDNVLFKGPRPFRPQVEFSDSVRDDPKEIAATAQMLATADAASKRTLVGMVHPDWTDDQIDDEVKLILAQGPPPSIRTSGPGISPGPGGAPAAPGLPSETPVPAVGSPVP